MGDHYEQYRERDRLKGRLKLHNQAHEDAIHLMADGSEKTEVVTLLEGKITLKELESLLATPLGMRRLNYLSQKRAREEFEPSTPDECLTYVKQKLVKLTREGSDSDKMKIEALKALAKVAMDERENAPAGEKPKLSSEEIKQLESFGTGG